MVRTSGAAAARPGRRIVDGTVVLYLFVAVAVSPKPRTPGRDLGSHWWTGVRDPAVGSAR